MFRDGQYLEVIKVSHNCMATAIITVKEKSVELDKKKICTNKWMNLEDWSSLYKIIQRAVLRNSKINHINDGRKSVERRKSTQRIDVIYSYEPPKDSGSLPTIKARVSPAKRRNNDENPSKTSESKDLCSPENQDSPETRVKRLMEGNDEEYVPPDVPNSSKSQEDFQYVPSRKSVLRKLKNSTNDSKSSTRNPYVPNSISSLRKKSRHEMYEPSGMSSLSPRVTEAYVPSSKGSSAVTCDEYTPTSGSKIDEETSYIPNSLASLKDKPKHDMYEPWEGSLLSSEVTEAYVPSSKGSKSRIEEYEPDFSTNHVSQQSHATYVPSVKKRKKDICEEKDEFSGEDKELKKKKYSLTKKKSVINGGSKREL